MDAARSRTAQHVNSEMVIAYWLIGQEIVHALQGGDARADYGSALMESLSKALTLRYKRGFSTTNLKYFRLFYQAYAHRKPAIRHLASDELLALPNSLVSEDLALALQEKDQQGFSANLSWTHYRTLCRIDNKEERLFYEVEA